MDLSKSEVEHIAHLSRIEVTDKEKENFSHQLSDILNYVSQLEQVDTEKVPETARVSDLSNVLAEDKVEKSSISQAELMKNAPEVFDNYFKVKTVLE